MLVAVSEEMSQTISSIARKAATASKPGSKTTEFMAAEVLKSTDKIISVDEELKASFSGLVTPSSAASLLEVEKSSIRSFMYWLVDVVNGKISATDAVGPANDGDGRFQGLFSELAADCSKIQETIDEAKRESLNMAPRKG
jgi:hypothetical protein